VLATALEVDDSLERRRLRLELGHERTDAPEGSEQRAEEGNAAHRMHGGAPLRPPDACAV
jgi:hypothetical protein